MSDESLAWKLAAVCVGSAAESVLDARLELLRAGFGDDHPVCRRLDSLATALTVEHDWCRGGALPAAGVTTPEATGS